MMTDEKGKGGLMKVMTDEEICGENLAFKWRLVNTSGYIYSPNEGLAIWAKSSSMFTVEIIMEIFYEITKI